VFWPGIMTQDSLSQWSQVSNDTLSDWHPFSMALVVGTLRNIHDSPWLPIMLVAAAAATLVGLAAAFAVRRGCARWLARTMTVLVAVTPAPLLMTSVLWKDVVMGVALLGLVVGIWRTLDAGTNRPLDNRGGFFLLVLAGVVMWLSRHNGWPVVVGTLLVVALLRSNVRRYILSALAVTAVVCLFVTGPVARLLDVTPNPVGSIVYVQHISAHIAAGTSLTTEEADVLNEIRPVDEAWPYDCTSVNETIGSPNAIPIGAYSDREKELRNIAISLALRAPGVEIDHLVCSSKIVWQVTETGTRTSFINLANRDDIVDTIRVRGTDSPMEQHASRSLALSMFRTVTDLPSALLRPALYTYALIAAVLVACRRRRSLDPLLIILPALIQTLALTPLVLVQDTRFQYGTILVSVVMTPLLLAVTSAHLDKRSALRWGRPAVTPDEPDDAIVPGDDASVTLVDLD
jgi:hypothetical protein